MNYKSHSCELNLTGTSWSAECWNGGLLVEFLADSYHSDDDKPVEGSKACKKNDGEPREREREGGRSRASGNE